MRIAFVGKGGSGKSTVSWLFTRFLAEQNKDVLAIDSDYNMDLSNALGWCGDCETSFLNQSEDDFYSYQNLSEKDLYVDLPKRESLKKFQHIPADSFTNKYAFQLDDQPNIRLMIAGDSSRDEILFGRRCTHAYLAPLKYYLPMLELGDNSVVLVDGVAGTDMVVYGLYMGVDALVVVVEPTPNSINVFKQIREIASKFNIPVKALINKYSLERENELFKSFLEKEEDILGFIPVDQAAIFYEYEKVSPKTKLAVKKIWDKLQKEKVDSNIHWDRFVEWRKKFDILEGGE